MEVEIIKMDNLGRGIGYLNNKIIFVPKTFPGDIVEVAITLEKKNYLEGKIRKLVVPSKKRIKPICPYFARCGGCDLMHISLSEALSYKLDKVNAILRKNKIPYEVKKIIKSKEQYHYRNKLTLKIINNEVCFYEPETHLPLKIDYCYLANEKINNLLKDLNKLNIQNGNVTIRINYKGEILLICESKRELENKEWLIHNYPIVGIIHNGKCLYGEEYLMDQINDYLFKISYDSFFQVNPYICSELFNLISYNTKDSLHVLDFYCGVGTLSIATSKNVQKTLGVEIIPNAVRDANLNKVINKRENLEFIASDTKEVKDKITSYFDTIILDPPRSGVNKDIIQKIKEENIPKIIYISCNPQTLGRDLNLFLDKYEIKEFILLDMFPNTEHIESFCVLKMQYK